MLFDVLSRELNVFEPHFLEASAGTGKTFAIEHLVTRLLIEGDNPFSIEQILVVTFTRAATRELKFRIRKNLVRTKESLLKGNPSLDYLQAIIEKGEVSVRAAAEKIEAALVCFDAAQIFTLHGFCHRILKEFAFEAGMGMEVSDPDERKFFPLLQEMIKEHLKDHLSDQEYSPYQIKAALKKKQSNPRKMVASLAQLVSSNKEIAAMPSFSELLEGFLKEICALPDIDADAFKADLDLLIPQYKQMTSVEIPLQIDALAEVLSSKHCSKKQFDRFLSADFFLEKMTQDNQKVRAKFPDPSELHYPDLVENLQKALLPPLEMARDPSRIFLRLARELQQKSKEFLERREAFSPDALLLKVEEALQNPGFIERIQKKYRAAIIDEFQDTDPIQWKIFQQLFLNELNVICLVGDPKQSIYAFRNADLYVYLEAKHAMGASAKKHLDTNFRSTAPLVEALNLLFSRAEKGWMPLPGHKEPLEVIPVKSGSGLQSDSTESPIQFFVAVGKKGRSKKFPTEEMFENKIFPFLASEIVKLHAAIAYHDIAILVKDRFQAKAVIDYLKECGIPASARRGGAIAETVAYHALKEILVAALAPYDMSRLKTALGGALIGWQASELESCLSAKAHMQDLSRILKELGFGPFFGAMLATKWKGQPLLQEIFSRGDQQLYIELRKLAEILIEEEIERGLKAEELLAFFEEMALYSDRDDSRFTVPSLEEKGSVTVMTMHMSKGLEFEAVFALGLASRYKPSEELQVRLDGRNVMMLLELSDPATLRALEEQDAEKMRQFYVALTRAKRHLYIPLMIEENSKKIELGEASPSELFFARLMQKPNDHEDLYRIVREIDLPKAAPIFESLLPQISYKLLEDAPRFQIEQEAKRTGDIEPPSPLPLHFDHTPIFSFSSLAKQEHSAQLLKPPEDAPLSPHTLPLGAETGHLLHQIFEKIFKRGLHHPLDEDKIAGLIEEELLFTPLEKWRLVLPAWIVALFTKSMGSFALSDLPKDQLQQEMEFLFQANSGMMKGFADLFFEFGGKYYLLDWKSNYLGPSDADYTQARIAEAMQHHQYDLQASIYAKALERYVKLFDNRPFAECFGGAIYYFVRGSAAFHFFPKEFL